MKSIGDQTTEESQKIKKNGRYAYFYILDDD